MDPAVKAFRRKRFFLILVVFFILVFLWSRSCSREENGAGGSEKKKTIPRIETSEEPEPDELSFPGVVRRGENLFSILTSKGLGPGHANGIVSEAGKLTDLRKIRAGNTYEIKYDGEGFLSFRYDIGRNRFVLISRNEEGGLNGKITVLPYRIEIELVEGVINGSLYETLMAIEPGGGELAEYLAALYEYDIDFNRDIRKGDYFSLLVEKKYLKGKFTAYGRIYASDFINRGKKTSVVRFASTPGKSSYYHPDGRAVRKMFLRCPLPFMRLTSRFGFRRHPVTGFSRAHKGIDLGAPRGTIVRASGDGRVYRTGYDRIRGRFVILSHGNRYRTHYYHLSRIKPGVGRGKWVAQGSVIGYVGNTGRSTGPHLHYGMQRNGRYINPLRLNSPSRNPVAGKDLDRFKRTAGVIFTLFDIGRSSILDKSLKQMIYRAGLMFLGDQV